MDSGHSTVVSVAIRLQLRMAELNNLDKILKMTIFEKLSKKNYVPKLDQNQSEGSHFFEKQV